MKMNNNNNNYFLLIFIIFLNDKNCSIMNILKKKEFMSLYAPILLQRRFETYVMGFEKYQQLGTSP
jgi:hypothetical protein